MTRTFSGVILFARSLYTGLGGIARGGFHFYPTTGTFNRSFKGEVFMSEHEGAAHVHHWEWSYYPLILVAGIFFCRSYSFCL